MKVTDLMVGDWVLDGTQIAQITSITFGGVIETTAHDFSNIEVVEPIPLTLEIMKANGYDFIKSYINYIYDNSEGSYLEMTLNDDGEFVWTINTNEYDITQIKYVHELQHALRLLGIEKEIIL